MDDIDRVMADRLRKLEALKEAGVDPYPNDFEPTASCAQALAQAAEAPPPDMGELTDDAPCLGVAGRVMARNVMGKAMFLRIRDGSIGVDAEGPSTLQLYARRDDLGADAYRLLKSVDVGDFVCATGPLFTTRTGEPTLFCREGRLLTKSLRPLPEKWHGLSHTETRYRQRYVDLIVNPEVRGVFRSRSRVLAFIRRFFEGRDFIEVETPMMHPIPGGATARPFETHHNALDMTLFLRIAPELYLKRLVVGGLERVFEVNRSFRNEGLSPKHNPEFTMLEFYQAYATYEDLMVLTETLLSELASDLNDGDGTTRPMGEHVVDYKAPFARHSVRDALVEIGGLPPETVDSAEAMVAWLETRGHDELPTDLPRGNAWMLAFDDVVEPNLVQPTFITHFPVEVSPLARRSGDDPSVTDRFELFVAGMEIANAFSELNDPIDQRGRFEAQVAARNAGDAEAMYMDTDYLRALEVGMPPTAGEGIGIDRLVMLMTNQPTIREVLLFPQMRPE